MDKIILNNKMLDTVLFWFNGARDKELREIPFNEIEIVLDYYENKIHIIGSMIYKKDRIIHKIPNAEKIVIKIKDNIKFDKVSFYSSEKLNDKTIINWCLNTVKKIFIFITNFDIEENRDVKAILKMQKFLIEGNPKAREKNNKSIDNVIKKKQHSKAGTKDSSVVNVFSLANEYKSKNEGLKHNKRQYKVTCDSWNVKGYYRKNKKTGKKDIWVKPYVKGKGKKKEKIYKV